MWLMGEMMWVNESKIDIYWGFSIEGRGRGERRMGRDE